MRTVMVHRSFSRTNVRTHLLQVCWMMRAASFLLLRSSRSCPLCPCVETSACVPVFLVGSLWSNREPILTEAIELWSLVELLSDVCSLWFLCFFWVTCASVLVRALCTFTCVSLLLIMTDTSSEWSMEETPDGVVPLVETGRSLILGLEGGLGLRVEGWLQPVGKGSSFSLVFWEEPDAVTELKWLWWLKASEGSAALVLLEDLLLRSDETNGNLDYRKKNIFKKHEKIQFCHLAALCKYSF